MKEPKNVITITKMEVNSDKKGSDSEGDMYDEDAPLMHSVD